MIRTSTWWGSDSQARPTGSKASPPIDPNAARRRPGYVRPDGWYWITEIEGAQEGLYQVGHWEGDYWWLTGEMDPFRDSEMKVHGAQIPYPSQRKP
jgi:hypothetical protein